MGELSSSTCIESYIRNAVSKYGKLFSVSKIIPAHNVDMFWGCNDCPDYVDDSHCRIMLHFVSPIDAVNNGMFYEYNQSDIIISDIDDVEGFTEAQTWLICTPIKFWSNRLKRYIPIAINDNIYTWLADTIGYELFHRGQDDMNRFMMDKQIPIFTSVFELLSDINLHDSKITSMFEGDSDAIINCYESNISPSIQNTNSDYEYDANYDPYSDDDDDIEFLKTQQEIDDYMSDLSNSKYDDDGTIHIGCNEYSFEGVVNLIKQCIEGTYKGD